MLSRMSVFLNVNQYVSLSCIALCYLIGCHEGKQSAYLRARHSRGSVLELTAFPVSEPVLSPECGGFSEAAMTSSFCWTCALARSHARNLTPLVLAPVMALVARGTADQTTNLPTRGTLRGTASTVSTIALVNEQPRLIAAAQFQREERQPPLPPPHRGGCSASGNAVFVALVEANAHYDSLSRLRADQSAAFVYRAAGASVGWRQMSVHHTLRTSAPVAHGLVSARIVGTISWWRASNCSKATE